MKVRCIEHVDHFSENEHVFWIEVDDIPKEFINKAKEIDKDEFLESCFGICVICTDTSWSICEDKPGHQLFYIDNDGNKHWMLYELTVEEEHDAIEYCVSDLQGE
jgi:hypothetical protein